MSGAASPQRGGGQRKAATAGGLASANDSGASNTSPRKKKTREMLNQNRVNRNGDMLSRRERVPRRTPSSMRRSSAQSARSRGRRTGFTLGTNVRKDAQGFDDISSVFDTPGTKKARGRHSSPAPSDSVGTPSGDRDADPLFDDFGQDVDQPPHSPDQAGRGPNDEIDAPSSVGSAYSSLPSDGPPPSPSPRRHSASSAPSSEPRSEPSSERRTDGRYVESPSEPRRRATRSSPRGGSSSRKRVSFKARGDEVFIFGDEVVNIEEEEARENDGTSAEAYHKRILAELDNMNEGPSPVNTSEEEEDYDPAQDEAGEAVAAPAFVSDSDGGGDDDDEQYSDALDDSYSDLEKDDESDAASGTEGDSEDYSSDDDSILGEFDEDDYVIAKQNDRRNSSTYRIEEAARALPTPDGKRSGLRRSMRQKWKPQKFWKTERLVQSRRQHSGIEAVLPIVVGSRRETRPTPFKPARKRRTKRAVTSADRTETKRPRPGGPMETEEDIKHPNIVESTPTLEVDNDGTVVELHKSTASLPLEDLPGLKGDAGPKTRAAVAFMHDGIRSGIVELRPGATKLKEPTMDCAQIFSVHKCTPRSLQVEINSKTVFVSEGDMFLVPPHSVYHLKNLSEKVTAVIYYTIVDFDGAAV